MKREIVRVEPLSTYLENWKAPTSAVTRSGDTIYVSGFPPFDPEHRNGDRGADRASDRTCPGADEALPGNGGLVIGERAQVQRVLHVGREIRSGERDRRPLLPEGPARADLCLRARVAEAVRHRDRLHCS